MIRKLIVQIPCLNEEETLPGAIEAIPREVPGFDRVEVLVIDDGSTDGTCEVALEHGADYVVSLKKNMGLAKAFCIGLDACIQRGADVIVNTDGDQQYVAADIPRLVRPIVDGQADMVVGARPIRDIESFPWWKKLLQRLGSRVVRTISGTKVEDATSGFRAFSRDAARRLHVFRDYTYTLETIVQAGRSGLVVVSEPIRTNPPKRPSRLIRNVPDYLFKSVITLGRSYATYRPFQCFFVPGCLMLLAAGTLSARFLGYYFGLFDGGSAGHVQSLILTAILATSGLGFLITALVVDLVSVNRQLLESIEYRTSQLESALPAGAAARENVDKIQQPLACASIAQPHLDMNRQRPLTGSAVKNELIGD